MSISDKYTNKIMYFGYIFNTFCSCNWLVLINF